MTPDEARTLLSLNAEASSAQRLEAHARLKGELETKLGRAPTEGLKAKYRDAITRLDQAIEVLEIAGMGADLPALAPSRPLAAPAAVPAPTASAMSARPQLVSPPSKTPMYLAITAAAVIAVGGVGWFMHHQSTRNAAATALTTLITGLKPDAQADEIRNVAAAAADFPAGFADDYQAAVKSAWTGKEKALGARATQIGAEEKARAEGDAKRSAMLLDDRLTEGKRRLNTLEQVKVAFDESVRQAERQVSDLKSTERDVSKTAGWQLAYVRQERIGRERYLEWLNGQKVSNPAWVNLANAADFLRDKKIEATELEIADADKSLARLREQQKTEESNLISDPLWKSSLAAWLSGGDESVGEYVSRMSVNQAALTELRESLDYLNKPGEELKPDSDRRIALLMRLVGEPDEQVVSARAEQVRRLEIQSTIQALEVWNSDAMRLPEKGTTTVDRLAKSVGTADARVIAGRALVEKAIAARDVKAKADEEANRLANAPDDSAGMYGLRTGTRRKMAVARLGGSDASEAAVANALRWFTRHQSPNGQWDVNNYGVNCTEAGERCEPGIEDSVVGTDISCTSYALLCFLGAGYDHKTPNEYKRTVKTGIDWLKSVQQADGRFGAGGNWEHAIAAAAIHEAYYMTSDPDLRGPMQKSLAVIIKNQCKDLKGNALGWDYGSSNGHIMTAVSMWNSMALVEPTADGLLATNEMTGVHHYVTRAWEAGNKDFNASNTTTDTSGFPYRWKYENDLFAMGEPGADKNDMAPAGALCAILAGHKPNSIIVNSLANHIIKYQTPAAYPCNTFTLFCGTNTLFQIGDERWTTWNGKVRDMLVSAQRDAPDCFAGSWDFEGTQFDGNMSGRLLSTAYCCLSLEVYYRYRRITTRP